MENVNLQIIYLYFELYMNEKDMTGENGFPKRSN